MPVDLTAAREALASWTEWVAAVGHDPRTLDGRAAVAPAFANAVDHLRDALARVAELERAFDAARSLLGDCFVLAGGDTDGDGWQHTWGQAVGEVEEMRDGVAEQDAEITRLTSENRRLRDLVRHQRGPLFDAELITQDEYAALAGDHGAVKRLEGYDTLRARLTDLEHLEASDPRDARIAALESAARAVLSLTGEETMEEGDAVIEALAGLVGVTDA